ncbi:MAG: 1-acyl-sn-glycerol-3-phosphate acyltransferase [Gammaproteobacteria bacterium]|nr:1-acyl-sn-glycerol-3-phosphate acyltransferase [Gammaproteobacteria bacterium]
MDRLWRFFATTILYIVFGIGALIITVTLIPLAVIFSPSRAQRTRRVRRINQLAFRAFVVAGSLLGVFEFIIKNQRVLTRSSGEIIIANHPSLLDVVFLLAFIENCNCVVKKNLLRNPFLAMQVYFADYILNDAGDDILQTCVDSLEKGESVIIFPEGTRTIDKQELTFKRGAAYLMTLSKGVVRPVHITCEPSALGKYDPWYRIPERRIHYEITALAPIDIEPLRNANHMGLPLKTRRLTKYLLDLYRELEKVGPDRIGAYRDINGIIKPC